MTSPMINLFRTKHLIVACKYNPSLSNKKNKYAENNHNKYQSIKNVSFDIGVMRF